LLFSAQNYLKILIVKIIYCSIKLAFILIFGENSPIDRSAVKNNFQKIFTLLFSFRIFAVEVLN